MHGCTLHNLRNLLEAMKSCYVIRPLYWEFYLFMHLLIIHILRCHIESINLIRCVYVLFHEQSQTDLSGDYAILSMIDYSNTKN